MPIFQYYCEKCNKHEDRLVRFDDRDEQYCSCSKSKKMMREDVLGIPLHSFKGNWYKTTKRY